MRKKSLWVAACLCFCLCAVRQAAASSGNPESHYDRGVSLYEKQRYAAAQAEFEKAAREAGHISKHPLQQFPVQHISETAQFGYHAQHDGLLLACAELVDGLLVRRKHFIDDAFERAGV